MRPIRTQPIRIESIRPQPIRTPPRPTPNRPHERGRRTRRARRRYSDLALAGAARSLAQSHVGGRHLLHSLRHLHEPVVHVRGGSLDPQIARRRDADRDQRGGSVHGAVQAGAGAGQRDRHPLRAVSGLGVRGARAVQARKKACHSAAHLQRAAVLSGRGLRLLRGVPRDAELLRRHHSPRCADDDRHGQLSRFCDGPAALLRFGLRSSGGYCIIGVDRICKDRDTQEKSRLRVTRDIHLCRLRDASRCRVAECDGGTDVFAVRNRDHHGRTIAQGQDSGSRQRRSGNAQARSRGLNLSPTFFGHPRGLATLFFTEMWERFTYYGMRAVLVLYLVAAVSAGGFGIDDKTAVAIYGLYTAGTYLVALPGGWIADRLIGARRAVLIGGLGITLGNVLLATSGSPRAFYIGLAVIVFGVGLLKPNVSCMVAELYPEGGARRDAGFTVFYMGINVGATLGPFVTGEAQKLFGPRAGFAATAIGMALGLLQYCLTQRHLGDAGRFIAPPAGNPERRKPWRQLWIGVGLLALALTSCSVGWVSVNPVSLAQGSTALIVSMAVLYFGYLFTAAGR